MTNKVDKNAFDTGVLNFLGHQNTPSHKAELIPATPEKEQN
jgi:hypothetical protein